MLFLSAVSAICVGCVWDRTCNTDPNSIDACAPWRLGTIDMMYQNVMHARLSTGTKSHFAATGTSHCQTHACSRAGVRTPAMGVTTRFCDSLPACMLLSPHSTHSSLCTLPMQA